MAQQFLNYEGLLALWAKIKAADATNASSISELQEQINNLPSDYSKVNDVKINDGILALYADGVMVGSGVSVADFVKDGMVDDIEVVEATVDSPIEGATAGKFLKFTWNVSAGSKVAYISAAELGQVDLTPLMNRVSALESSSETINSKLESLESELDIAQADIEALKAATGTGEVEYEDITKDEEGLYVGDSANAPKTSSVVAALNELKSLVKPADFSDYYNKEEIDSKLDTKLNITDIISTEIIESLF